MNVQIERVALNLNQAIVEFWKKNLNQRFTANDLRRHVNHYNYGTAPASADRVMRYLKKSGKINYTLVNRAKSLYIALPLEYEEGKA